MRRCRVQTAHSGLQAVHSEAEFPQTNSQQPTLHPHPLPRYAELHAASPQAHCASQQATRRPKKLTWFNARSPCAHPKSIIQGPGPRLAPIAGLSGNATRTGKSPKGGPKNIINPSKAMMFCQKQKNGPLPSPHCQLLIKPPPPPRLCPAAACLSTFLSGAIPPWPWKGVAPAEGAISDWPITLPST